MKSLYGFIMLVCATTFGFHGVAMSDIIEQGDLNIIDDPTNPSHGLRYLDMTYSVGLDLNQAIANASPTYPNVRPADRYELSHLVAAASIDMLPGASVLDAYTAGPQRDLAMFDADVSVLVGILTPTTVGPSTVIWTDPDGSSDPSTTRDFVTLHTMLGGYMWADNSNMTIPHPLVGHLLVTEIPIPSTILLMGSGLIGLAGFRRRFK